MKNRALARRLNTPSLPLPRLLPMLVASTFSLGASAQEQPAAPADAAPPAAEQKSDVTQVLVTGTRRRTPVREVPMAVNTVGAEQLSRSGAGQLSEYLDSLPGVMVDSGGGRGMQQMSIRGVTLGGDVNPPTSTYLDDIPYGGSNQHGAKMSLDIGALDLHHIEVYRGPQGTLYGANALGGVLKYVFNEPSTKETSGYARAEVSSTKGGGVSHSESAVVNLPLKPGVAALRVGAIHTKDGGHIDAVGPLPGERTDRSTAKGYRVAGLLTPTRNLAIKLSFFGQRLDRDGNDVTEFSAAGRPVYGEDIYKRYTAEPFRQKVEVGALEVDYDMQWARLNAVYSHQKSDNSLRTDLSAVYVPAFAAALPGLSAAWSATQVDTSKDTLELRLTSARSDKLEWLAGLFAVDEDNLLAQTADTQVGSAAGPNLIGVSMPNTYREVAAFGDLTVHPTAALALTVGARYSRNKQDFRQQITGMFSPGTTDMPAHSRDSSRTWLATAKYSLAPKSSVYVRVATGYNPGGVNPAKLDPASGGVLTENPSYEANTLLSAEAGYKAELFDNRLALDVALFRLNWKDLQVPHATAAGNEVVNAGRARVNGLEFSAVARPAEGWTIAPSFAYVDGAARDNVPDVGAQAGDRLPVTPKWSASLRLGREFTVAGNPAHAALSWRYVGERNSNFAHSLPPGPPNHTLPAYSIFNLNAGVELGAFTVNLFARNLADKRGQVTATTGYLPSGGPMLVSLTQPRTIGFNVQYSY